jgi:hypothetical protein
LLMVACTPWAFCRVYSCTAVPAEVVPNGVAVDIGRRMRKRCATRPRRLAWVEGGRAATIIATFHTRKLALQVE